MRHVEHEDAVLVEIGEEDAALVYGHIRKPAGLLDAHLLQHAACLEVDDEEAAACRGSCIAKGVSRGELSWEGACGLAFFWLGC